MVIYTIYISVGWGQSQLATRLDFLQHPVLSLCNVGTTQSGSTLPADLGSNLSIYIYI
jgi:hypothetical protein